MFVCERACTDLNDMWHVRQCVHVFTLLRACARSLVCVWKKERERSCVFLQPRTRVLSHISVPQGTTLKICGSSSLLVSEQRLSARSSIAVPAALPPLSFVTLVPSIPSIPPSVTTLFQNMAPWRARTHKLRPAVSPLHFQRG